MSETPHHLSFEKMSLRDDREIYDLTMDFQLGDYISANTLKKYAREISEKINSAQTAQEQKIFLIDLLRDEAINSMIDSQSSQLKYSEADMADLKKMAAFATKEIKKKIIEELKEYLSDDLYFFIKELVTTKEASHNTRMIVQNKNGELFLKTTDKYTPEEKDNIQSALNTLRTAMSALANPSEQMPYLPEPIIITEPSSSKSLGFAVESKQIATLQEIFGQIDNTLSLKEKLSALIDCLRGAEFLAKHDMTLTDLSTSAPGRNMGIDKKTKKGILFDLDGLLPADKNVSSILVGMKDKTGTNLQKVDLSLVAPEYRQLTADGIPTVRESMIWEFGDTINRLAEAQLKNLWASGNFFSNHNIISVWEKLKEFSHKMMAQEPKERPSFDICIAKLEGIVNKYLHENK